MSEFFIGLLETTPISFLCRVINNARNHSASAESQDVQGKAKPQPGRDVDVYMRRISKRTRGDSPSMAMQRAIEDGRDMAWDKSVAFHPNTWLEAMVRTFGGRLDIARIMGVSLRSQEHLTGLQLGILIGLLPNLRILCLSGLELDLGDFRALVTKGLSRAKKLTTLEMSYAGLDADKAKVLADAPNLRGLESLDIGGNSELGDEGVYHIAMSPNLTNLYFLDISYAFPYQQRQALWPDKYEGPGTDALRARQPRIPTLDCDDAVARGLHTAPTV